MLFILMAILILISAKILLATDVLTTNILLGNRYILLQYKYIAIQFFYTTKTSKIYLIFILKNYQLLLWSIFHSMDPNQNSFHINQWLNLRSNYQQNYQYSPNLPTYKIILTWSVFISVSYTPIYFNHLRQVFSGY